MLNNLMVTVNQYWNYYQSSLIYQWQTMNPTKYSTLLICIGVIGWLLMKNSSRR